MPSTSKAQQRLMAQAYSLKKGVTEPGDIDPEYRKEIEDLAQGMTQKQLKDFASTKHKGLPDRVKKADEGSAATPANVNGMGPVTFPGDPGTMNQFPSQKVGSGDIPASSALTKKNKKKKVVLVKMFEEFLFEAFIEDPGVKAQIGTFYELQEQIKKLEAELEEKKLQFKQFEGDVKPMIDGMKEVGDKLAETEEYLIKVSRFGGERKDASYKTAFENALGKVNAATKRVLEEALEASKKVTQVKHSFSIDKVVAEASLFDKIKSAIKGAINKLLGVFKKESKTIDDANKDLKKLV
jgi:hypothetical protein